MLGLSAVRVDWTSKQAHRPHLFCSESDPLLLCTVSSILSLFDRPNPNSQKNKIIGCRWEWRFGRVVASTPESRWGLRTGQKLFKGRVMPWLRRYHDTRDHQHQRSVTQHVWQLGCPEGVAEDCIYVYICVHDFETGDMYSCRTLATCASGYLRLIPVSLDSLAMTSS